jgi:hypothetical protein
MSTGVWAPAPTTGPLIVGAQYRLKMTVRAPYNEGVVAALKAAFRVKLNLAKARILRFEFAAPNPMWSAHGTPPAVTWPFHVVFTVDQQPVNEASLDPRAILAIAALVVVASLSFFIVSSKLERFVETVGEQVRETVRTGGDELRKTFNPGVLVLAFGAFYLFTKGR